MKKVFITGASGFIGSELMISLVKEQAIEFTVLLRSKKQQSFENRCHNFLRYLENRSNIPYSTLNKQIDFIEGDLREYKLGLPHLKFLELAEKNDTIIHGGASVHLNPKLDAAMSINYDGTNTLLELAKIASQKNVLKRFNYISTAYVAGKREGRIFENELVKGQDFNNNYERSKFEAEKIVEQAKQELPITIFRPSIVMGHSQSGWTKCFNVIYGPLKLGYFGKLPIAPGCRKSKIDAVPIDYIIDSINYLSNLGDVALGQTYHLTVGRDRSISAIEIQEMATESFLKLVDEYNLENPRRIPYMMNPKLFKFLCNTAYQLSFGKTKKLLNELTTYVDYTLYYKEFDNSLAKAQLESANISAPKLQDYIDTLCRYAVESHFGKSDHPCHVTKKKKRKLAMQPKLKSVSV